LKFVIFLFKLTYFFKFCKNPNLFNQNLFIPINS
jgi:hypothetical protein